MLAVNTVLHKKSTPISIFLQLLQILQIFKLKSKKLQVQVQNAPLF